MTNTISRPEVPADATNPTHYRVHPSGIECIELTELLPFCVGNAVKYLWRADLKNGREDLRKALWYVKRASATNSNLNYHNGARLKSLLGSWRHAEPAAWRRVVVDALVRAVLAPLRVHAVLALGEAQRTLEMVLGNGE